jgi:prevent-host-death family protein
MNTKVSTADARKNFADILNRVAYGKEQIVLTRRGQDVAALISMKELELLQKLEDLMDIEDVQKALDEPGENIVAAEVWKELGL